MAFSQTGCPIRKSPDHRIFAPTRRLSQLITSFIASESQGIRRAPLDTFSQHNNTYMSLWLILSAVFSVLNSISKIKNRNLSLRFTVLLVSICQRSFESEKWKVKSEEWKIHLIFLFSFFTFPLLEWRITDSNRWPPACKAGALASWANPPKK